MKPITINKPDQAKITRRGSEVLLDVLKSEGVEYIFGNPGTTELALIDSLVETPEIKYIWGLQEATVVAMGDGYAKASGKPGFINLHTAGGLGHGMGNLLNASISGTPLVITAGQQDTRHILTDPLLSGDLVGIASRAVKWGQELTKADQIPTLLRRAFHDCVAAPTGPVFLSLPMDIMEEMTSVDTGERSIIDTHITGGSLETLSRYLTNVRPGKVAIIAGDEVASSKAGPEVVELAECLAAPVFGSSFPSCIPYQTSHPLWAGNLPTKAVEISEHLKSFDCVFALGGKSLITILYTEGCAIPEGCEVYQLSSDVRDLGRTYPTRLSVVGDIKTTLRALLPILDQMRIGKKDIYTELLDKAAERKTHLRNVLIEKTRDQWSEPEITPLVAAYEITKAIGPKTAIVDEAVATATHVRNFLNSNSFNQYSFLRGGGLGWGMPAAVGYSLGLGREPVVSLVGDGAALYSPQALWTAAKEKLPVTFIVLNNREYNVLKNFMKSQPHYKSPKQNKFIAMDINDPPINFTALANSMGLEAVTVTQADEIGDAVTAGIKSGKPNLIEIIIGIE